MRKSEGFTYLGLLISIAIMGVALAGAGTLWSAGLKHERERELLHIGHKIQEAIGQYYNHTPGTVKQYPKTLEVLLRDDRFPMPQRYLRKIYPDPFTGKPSWGTIEAPSGGIMGIYSLAQGLPSKVDNFRPSEEIFKGKKSYLDWIFVYVPPE